MKKFFILLLCLVSLQAFGAANIFTGAVDANWGTAGNWSLVLVPTASDGNPATFDNTSPNCTVNTSARVCNGIDFSGYTNTITMSQQITVTGSITLESTMGISGSGALIAVAASATHTSDGKTWPNAMQLGGIFTHTLADNWTVTGLLTLGSAGSTTINSNTITANGGVTFAGTTSIVLGTTTLKIGGTGTVTGATSTGQCRLSLTVDAGGGTVTFASTPFNYNTGTLTYVSGTMSMGTSSLVLGTANTTLACAGITWPALTITGAFTFTLNENLVVSGLTTLGTTTSATVINGSQINMGGGLRFGCSTGTISGTAILNFTGAGTFDAPSITTGKITSTIYITAGSGTITVTSPIVVDFGLVKFVSGAVTTTAGTWASGAASGSGYIFSK